MGALAILGLSTLPYFHEFITTSTGLRPSVPHFGIEKLLTDPSGSVLGFSSYRVFLYTFLIFVFAAIGFAGWYAVAKHKYYRSAVLLVLLSGAYQLLLIVFHLRQSVFNETGFKLMGLVLLILALGIHTFKNDRFTIIKAISWVGIALVSTLPFLHDLVTDKSGSVWPFLPNLGIEPFLTDADGMVRGLRSYRLLLYLFGIYLFSHIGWLGWFMDAEHKKYRFFLLVPAALSLYQLILIALAWRETTFNSPGTNLFITIGLGLLIAINFYFNNKAATTNEGFRKTPSTITNDNEN